MQDRQHRDQTMTYRTGKELTVTTGGHVRSEVKAAMDKETYRNNHTAVILIPFELDSHSVFLCN